MDLHDFGTTFKAYRREVLSEIHLYGELHRFIPALASWAGASVAEVPISNIARKKWGVQLRDIADRARVAGFDEREVFAGLFDEAFAIFWVAGIGVLERRSWNRVVGVPPQSALG